MSDEPNPNASPGGGDAPKKRRRRRRRNKSKSPQNDSAQASAEQAANPNTPAPEKRQSQGDGQKPRGDRPPKAGNGYRGKNQKPNAGSRSSGPKRENAKNRDESKGKGPRSSSNGAPPDRPGQTAAKPKAKKRRKPRTKQCVNCYTPCTTIHRVRLDYRKQWVFICDICWPTRCVDNPHYEFGGTWVSGRIVKPESQQRDEWLAKQKQKKSNQSPRQEKTNEDYQPKANHDAAASSPPDAAPPSDGEPNHNQQVETTKSPAASVEVSAQNEAPTAHDQTAGESQPSDGHAAADPPTEEGQGG